MSGSLQQTTCSWLSWVAFHCKTKLFGGHLLRRGVCVQMTMCMCMVCVCKRARAQMMALRLLLMRSVGCIGSTAGFACTALRLWQVLQRLSTAVCTTMQAQASRSNWSEFPPELLDTIAQRNCTRQSRCATIPPQAVFSWLLFALSNMQ